MSRFKRIKNTSTKKSSVSIDEKIAALNQELEKTGMLSEMTTDDVYVTGTEEPNPAYEDFIAASFGGKGFAMSGFGGAKIGGATFDDNGLAFGPDGSGPATSYLGLSSGFGPAVPGSQRTPEHRKIGAFLWYWNGSGYSTLEWKFNNQNVDNSGGWASWQDTAFGFPHLVFISAIPGFDPALAAAVASAGGGGAFPDPDDVTSPTNPVFTKDRLGEPGFLPIDIAKRKAGGDMGTSPEAFDSFSEKSKGDKGEDDKGEEDEGDEEEERKKREELVKKLKLGFASGVGVSLKTIQRLWSNGSALGNLWKMTDSFLKGDTDFDSLNRLSNSITKTVGRAIGKQAGVPTPTNFLFRYDKWLASGAKGKVDMTRYIDSRSAKILSNAANKLDGRFMKTETIKQQFKRLTSEGKSRKEALDEIATAVQRSVDNQTNADSRNANLKMAIGNGIQIDRKSFVESGGKIIKFSKGYKFAENVGSVKGVGDTMLGRFYGAFGIEMDTFGSGKYAVPAVIGAKYGLQSVHRKYGGSPDRAPQMPYSFTVKSGITGDISESYWKTYEWIDLTKVENDEPISLQEDVKLGYFDPEELNVDIEDLRKGIMPEYPKKAPPEMIDGYSATSKLAPRVVKGEPTIKITRKDLAKFHKLKKSEIDEFMNTVKRINNYLQKHPEELIYAQQRYPKDDPRLAALNWKMDQMNEAGKKYIDQNFKVNQTLYKRATERTQKNIKLTDPEYVQQNYDELRGTIKPKKTKLVGRLGKHLNKYESKSLFKHVNSKNFKKINERKIERKEQVKQIQKEIEIEFQEKKNDWRKDLGNNTY